ncbi:hypothetical protein NPIL_423851 [Nephila pilipes]|uniref:Uncharacterized protein n=1 Tax=Nephila pilipes TaxID=299642 RepID=A0A8X6TW92_NEPPI|nr:hypothetical protein NPIL_423851 [Nephila pilipes]
MLELSFGKWTLCRKVFNKIEGGLNFHTPAFVNGFGDSGLSIGGYVTHRSGYGRKKNTFASSKALQLCVSRILLWRKIRAFDPRVSLSSKG